jgi:N-acetylmuramoyl-L-alanine amidase
VVVDAGHGGPDRGMKGPLGARNKVHEADITLAVAKRLRDQLQSRGVDVLMTRETDTLIALDDRGRIANDAGANLFLSIHVNAANPRWRSPRSARGFETYFLAEAKTEDEQRVAEMENESMRFEVDVDAKPGDPLSFLLSDMMQNEYLRESSTLAATVQGGLRTVHPSTDRGVKQAGFRVLITAHMPAVLVELGFGTNAPEVRWLSSAKGQQALAKAIANATIRYLDDYDRRVNGGSGSP